MKYKSAAGQFALLVAALIWGSAFSAQKSGTAFLPPLVFNAFRLAIGTLFLIPVIALLDLAQKRRPSFWGTAKTARERGRLLLSGFCCGTALAVASLLQQWGMNYTSAGKAGFFTALYIIGVPVIGIFLRKKTNWLLWTSVGLALIGTYLLCSPGGRLCLNFGDVLLLLCACAFSCHILVIDHFAQDVDGVRMSCLQFFTACILSTIFAPLFPQPWTLHDVSQVILPLLVCGILSNGIAYTLQIVGQKYVHPVIATLLMSLESVFAVLGGWIFLNEHLTIPEFLGCGIIFAAVLLVQLPPDVFHRKKGA